MNIVPKDGPAVAQPPQSSARERAIAKLMGNTQQTPVVNPSQVSPEEMSAISTPERKAEQNQQDTEESLQSTTNDTSKSDTEQSEVSKAAPKDEPLSTQYALLARKEKALRAKVQAQESATKAREEALIAREEALKAKEAEYATNYISKSRIKEESLAVLEESGVSYDDLTAALLSPKVQQDPRLVAELEKLKAEVKATRDYQEQAKKTYEDQQKQAYQQAVTQIRNEVKSLVASDANFETIKETGSVDDVVELIEKTYHKDGILLTVEEASKEVEEYLVEQAMKLAKINKIKSRLQPVETPAAKQTEPAKQQPQMKTLTNSVNAAKKLNARERAIAAFKGQLK